MNDKSLTVNQAKEKLQNFVDDGCIGNVTFFRGPHKDTLELIYERTIKPSELPDGVVEAAHYLIEQLGTRFIEIRAKEGTLSLIRLKAFARDMG